MEFVYRRTYLGPVKLVVFDWAGTTMDYGCYAPAVVFMEVFKRRGVEITMEQARRPMGLKKVDHIRAISQQDEVAELWHAAHDRACTEEDVQEMFEKDFRPLQIECIGRYTKLIPGTVETVKELRGRGIKIGSTSGYFTEAMEINYREAEKQGYVPDCSVCASDVPAGRPEPWMVIGNMQQLRIFPPEAVIKVDDTKPGIEEGLNASVWTVGLSRSGNEVGLNEEEIAALPEDVARRKIARADEGLRKTGAHYVVETIAEIPAVIDDVDARLSRAERP